MNSINFSPMVLEFTPNVYALVMRSVHILVVSSCASMSLNLLSGSGVGSIIQYGLARISV